MALFKNMSITYKGMALYAKAQAGQEIHFTKMQVGSGQIGTQNPATLIALLDPKLDVNITSITANPDLKSATIIGNVTNTNVTQAIYICEIGLWANDPDDGEILYGYANCGTYGDYYAPESQGPYSWQYEIAAAIGNAANVTAELSQLIWDYGIMNSNPIFIHLKGGNQKEINKSIDDNMNKIDTSIKGMTKLKPNITIISTGWIQNATTALWEYKITDTDINANTMVDINVQLNYLEKAEDLKPVTQSFAGYVLLYAQYKPLEDIKVDMKLIRQVV